MKPHLPFSVLFFAVLLCPMPPAVAEPGAPEKEVEAVASNVWRIPAAYQPVEGGITRLNGTIFYNRPLYCNGIPVQVVAGDLPGVRIATNAYQAWTMVCWGLTPPPIGLENLPQLLNAEGRIQTARGVPFSPPDADKNAAIVSLWDNWPKRVSVDVNQRGSALWLLIAGSTNPWLLSILVFSAEDVVSSSPPACARWRRGFFS